MKAILWIMMLIVVCSFTYADTIGTHRDAGVYENSPDSPYDSTAATINVGHTAATKRHFPLLSFNLTGLDSFSSAILRYNVGAGSGLDASNIDILLCNGSVSETTTTWNSWQTDVTCNPTPITSLVMNTQTTGFHEIDITTALNNNNYWGNITIVFRKTTADAVTRYYPIAMRENADSTKRPIINYTVLVPAITSIESNGYTADPYITSTTTNLIDVTTNFNSDCSWALVNESGNYTAFINTGGTSHSTNISGLQDGNDYVYINCSNGAQEITEKIRFAVQSSNNYSDIGTDLVGWLRFNESSTPYYNVPEGSGSDGTGVNTPTRVAGVPTDTESYAISFDSGSSEKLTATWTASNTYTVNYWQNVTQSPADDLMLYSGWHTPAWAWARISAYGNPSASSRNFYWAIGYSDNSGGENVNACNWNSSLDETWVMFTVSVNSNKTVRMYMNGVLCEDTIMSKTPDTLADLMQLGFLNIYKSITVDEWALWDRNLNDTEIDLLVDGGTDDKPMTPPFIAYTFNTSSWWDYDYRQVYDCTEIGYGKPSIINGSGGFYIDGIQQIVWTTCNASQDYMYVYYDNNETIVVTDGLYQMPHEVESGTASSYNPENVWGADTISYLFNEESGSLIDSAGNVNATTSTGQTYRQPGLTGYSIHFDGSDDEFYMDANTLVNTGTGDFSICIDTNPDQDTADSRFYGNRDGNPQVEFSWDMNGVNYIKAYLNSVDAGNRILIYNNGDPLGNDAGEWSQVCFARTGAASGTLWINETEPTVSEVLAGNADLTEDRMYIGSVGDAWWTGYLDNFRFYDYAITTDQVNDSFQNKLGTEGYFSYVMTETNPSGGDIIANITDINCTSPVPDDTTPPFWTNDNTPTYSITTDYACDMKINGTTACATTGNVSYFTYQNYIDTIAPNGTITSPTASQQFNQTILSPINISVIFYDFTDVNNISCLINGTVNATNSSPVNNEAWTWEFTPSVFGEYVVDCYAWDNVSTYNEGSTGLTAFNIWFYNIQINASYGENISAMTFYANLSYYNWSTQTITQENSIVVNQTDSNPYLTICNNGSVTLDVIAWVNESSDTYNIKCSSSYNGTKIDIFEDEYCYQESVNVSTTCGGLDTGTYDEYRISSVSGYTYMNYSIPNEATSAIWTVKYSGLLFNFTIINSCFNNSEILQLRILSEPQAAAGDENIAYCYNSSWVILHSLDNVSTSPPYGGYLTFNPAPMYNGNWNDYTIFIDGWQTCPGPNYGGCVSEEAITWVWGNGTTEATANTIITDLAVDNCSSIWCWMDWINASSDYNFIDYWGAS